jgi:ribonuclease R
VLEVLGEIDDPGMEIEIAVRKYEVPHRFTPETLAQAAALPDACAPPTASTASTCATCRWSPSTARTRATSTTPSTASPSSGPRQERLHQRLAADGGHRRRQPLREAGRALDEDAYERATSVYFPRRVIPMLPEKLSNGLCSLNPDEERLAMVCDMLVGEDGRSTPTSSTRR